MFPMAFWWFMLICALLCPLIMVFFGFLFLKHPPKGINAFYGYRTARSMRSRECWDYANRYFGRLILAGGTLCLPVCILLLLLMRDMGETQIAVAGLSAAFFGLIVLLVTVFMTEHRLRRGFR